MNTSQNAYTVQGKVSMVSLLVVGVLIVSSMALTPQLPQVHQGLPPKALHGLFMAPAVMHTNLGGIKSEVSFQTTKRTVDVTWTRLGPKRSSTQTVPVMFYPTAVAGMDGSRILVAGKDMRTGATKIELWTFDEPGTVAGPLQDPISGETIWPAIDIPVVSKKLVFSSTAIGQDMVSALFWNLGKQDEVFVQFHDSRDVYTVNINTLADHRILSASAGPTVPFDIKLNWVFHSRMSIDHEQLGYVYILNRRSNTPAGLSLVDSNKDGVLDFDKTFSMQGMSQVEAWFATGVQDDEKILRFY